MQVVALVENEAKVEIDFVLKPVPAGEIKKYPTSVHHKDWVSIYGAKNDTPSMQLMEAFTLALENLRDQIENDPPAIREKPKTIPVVPLGPSITFIEPKSRSTKKREINIAAMVESSEGLAEVAIWHNNRFLGIIEPGGDSKSCF